MKTRLQELRKAAGYKSANAFADHMGLKRGTYTDYEQGRISISLELAWAFADEFDVSLDELAGRERPKKEYADERQANLNELYGRLDDANRSAAVGAVRGIVAAQAEEKTTSERAASDTRRAV